jgi:selenide,water dikinase
VGPGDLAELIRPLAAVAGGGGRVLIGPESSDDAGVYLHEGRGLIATADFIPPVCDDPRRFGRVAAVNSLSDVWAMGGRPLFALNLCCFPDQVPPAVRAEILGGGADALRAAGAALLGGHSVADPELKYGLAVVGEVDPQRILANGGARPGDRVILTKPLGTGVLINAFKFDKLDEEGLEPALVEMERPNAEACRLALEHGVRAATDVTGFGLAGHAWNVARASRVGLRLERAALPVHAAFERLQRAGVTTGCTRANRDFVGAALNAARALTAAQAEILFDPQTSGGLLLFAPADRADSLLTALREGGHHAALIGEVVAGEPRIDVV